MQSPSAHTWLAFFQQLTQILLRVLSDATQLFPRQKTRGMVWRLQCDDRLRDGGHVVARHMGLLSFWCNPVDAALHFLQTSIGHVVTSHPGIIPISNKN